MSELLYVHFYRVLLLHFLYILQRRGKNLSRHCTFQLSKASVKPALESIGPKYVLGGSSLKRFFIGNKNQQNSDMTIVVVEVEIDALFTVLTLELAG